MCCPRVYSQANLSTIEQNLAWVLYAPHAVGRDSICRFNLWAIPWRCADLQIYTIIIIKVLLEKMLMYATFQYIGYIYIYYIVLYSICCIACMAWRIYSKFRAAGLKEVKHRGAQTRRHMWLAVYSKQHDIDNMLNYIISYLSRTLPCKNIFCS